MKTLVKKVLILCPNFYAKLKYNLFFDRSLISLSFVKVFLLSRFFVIGVRNIKIIHILIFLFFLFQLIFKIIFEMLFRSIKEYNKNYQINFKQTRTKGVHKNEIIGCNKIRRSKSKNLIQDLHNIKVDLCDLKGQTSF